MARAKMSFVLAAAAAVALCRSAAFVAAPKEVPRAEVLVPAALAPMMILEPACAQRMEGDFKAPQYNEAEPTSDLSYLLFFTAALLVYVGKTAFDKTGAKSLGDAVNK
ncbi:unnamed protein product [Symbiodinium pilosum]|uniref:Uncharacterized protein n=1 Tax=Symbiodinium pilosum TaxID=2952 RepID=A0A812JIP7_SYMPI|nr:unnamed protein product [Symbiodinium pilosum]